MSTPSMPARTLVALAAVGFVGVGPSLPAQAATTPRPKNVAIKPVQYPRMIDNAGADNDKVRLTKVVGAVWSVDGSPAAFAGGATSTDVPVTAAAQVTLVAASEYALPLGTPTAWDFAAPSAAEAPDVNADAVQATWNDFPGTKKDSVTIRKVDGITWTVTTGDTTATYDPDSFGTKPTLTLPATTATTVTADLIKNYKVAAPAKTLPAVANGITETAEVDYAQDHLERLVTVGENPFDGTKGFGPTAARETVKITGAPGLTWKVGSAKAKAVTGTQFIPVNAADLDAHGTVKVTPIAAKEYSVPAGISLDVEFDDKESAPKLVVADTDVRRYDRGGITNDTLTLATTAGMSWWVGQADRTGKIAYRAQKPGKDGTVVYKVKHATKAPIEGTTDATVFVKPVPNRGYELDTSALLEEEFDFSRDSTTVPSSHFAAAGTNVTFTPSDGLLSWALKYAVPTTGSKTTTKSLTVNAADIDRIGATSMSVALPAGAKVISSTPKLAKGYSVATVVAP